VSELIIVESPTKAKTIASFWGKLLEGEKEILTFTKRQL
jgi:hypothetical protein